MSHTLPDAIFGYRPANAVCCGVDMLGIFFDKLSQLVDEAFGFFKSFRFQIAVFLANTGHKLFKLFIFDEFTGII